MVELKEIRQNTALLFFQNLITNKFPEKDYPDQTGKVYVVTGGPTGIGFDVSRLLASKNAKVWLVARNQEKIDSAIERIKKEFPNADLDYFKVDFSDLTTIKPGVARFLAGESRLDGIIHNAGVMRPHAGPKSAQGYELQLGVNAVGPHLLQKLLDPIVIQTAKSAPPNSVRILWVSSIGHSLFSVQGGVNWEDMNVEKPARMYAAYGQSKAINLQQAILWPKHHADSGVVSFSCHPGSLKSEIMRNNGKNSFTTKLANVTFADAIYGAYTELYGVLSPEITTKNNGAYIIPWGRIGVPRKDVLKAANGPKGEKLWGWLEEQVADFL